MLGKQNNQTTKNLQFMKFRKKETLLKKILTRHLSFGHSHPFVYVTPVKGNPFWADPRDRRGY